MLFHFLFSVLLNYNRNYPGTTTRKEDALDVVANTAGAALAVFLFLYILKEAFR
jgi:VanZ family protein